MSFVSFKDYLKKFVDFPFEDKWLKQLFNGCAIYWSKFGGFVRFQYLLTGLAYLDSEFPSFRSRVEFVFDYYDFDRDGYLSEEEFREMIGDIYKNQSQEVKERVVSDNMFMII